MLSRPQRPQQGDAGGHGGILISASGLSLDQREWSWSEVRECLTARGGLGPLRWRYRATWGRAAYCLLEVFAPPGSPPLVVVTEDESNPGISVTNAAERLVQEIAMALGLDLQVLRFVECYTTPTRFAAVTFGVTPEGRALAAKWRHLALLSVADVAAAALALPAAARNLDTRACA